MALNNLGYVAYREGDYATALSFFKQSAEIDRKLGAMGLYALKLGNVGECARILGDETTARQCLLESLRLSHALGSSFNVANALWGLCELAPPESGVQLLAASYALFEQLKVKLNAAEQDELNEKRRRLREALGDAFEAGWAAGWAMSLEAAIALASRQSSPTYLSSSPTY